MDSKLVIGLNLVALIIGFVLGYVIYEPQLQVLQSQVADLQSQITDLQSQNNDLQSQIDALEQRLRAPWIGLVSQRPLIPGLMQEVVVNATVIDQDGVSHAILSYRVSGGSWDNVTMENIDRDVYQAIIPGFEPRAWVNYQIIAYDNLGEVAVEDDAGSYYSYYVIPEFPFTVVLLLALIFSTLVVIMLAKKSAREDLT